MRKGTLCLGETTMSKNLHDVNLSIAGAPNGNGAYAPSLIDITSLEPIKPASRTR